MYISGILIERKAISYGGCYTLADRDAYIKSTVDDWHKKHIYKIIAAGEDALYILTGAESKISRIHEKSWYDLIMKHGNQAAKKNIWKIVEQLEVINDPEEI